MLRDTTQILLMPEWPHEAPHRLACAGIYSKYYLVLESTITWGGHSFSVENEVKYTKRAKSVECGVILTYLFRGSHLIDGVFSNGGKKGDRNPP